MSESSTKFIGRNRKPRVHIEYEVETEGAMEKVSLPFVMGVMADLSGKRKDDAEPLESEKRKFVEFTHDNFDQRMAAIAPRAAFQVENKLTGEGKMGIDMSFTSIDDFAPDKVAEKVEPLRKMLEIRQQLDQLKNMVGGKQKAEKELNEMLHKLRDDPQWKQALSAPSTEPA